MGENLIEHHKHDDCAECLRRDNKRLTKVLAVIREEAKNNAQHSEACDVIASLAEQALKQ